MGKRQETPPSQPYFHPPAPNPSQNYNYILLPPYNPPPRRCSCLYRSLAVVIPIFLFSAALFLLWPSDPDLQLARLRLDHISLSPKKSSSSSIIPAVSIDVALDLTLRVRNRDFYSLAYRSLNVSIGYRGRKLGSATSSGGRVRARGSSYVDATLRLDGVEILHDVLYLIEDMARGLIPFDTVSEIDGKLGLLFISFPIKARVSCEVFVNTEEQNVTRQDCYPV